MSLVLAQHDAESVPIYLRAETRARNATLNLTLRDVVKYLFHFSFCLFSSSIFNSSLALCQWSDMVAKSYRSGQILNFDLVRKFNFDNK